MYFPPYNAIGSIRAGKLAKHLLERGHDVRIIAAERTGPPKTLPLEVPLDRVLYTPWWEINGIPRVLARLRRHLFGKKQHQETGAEGDAGPLAGAANGPPQSILRPIALLYQNLFNWPDARVGWLPFALLGARKHLRDWAPDILYASSPPATALVVGQRLARRYGVPWVAEFRDRWAEDPYDPRPPWRAALDRRLERRVLSSARGIVTVSETWAQAYRERYRKPTAVIYNGFMPENYERQLSEPPPGDRDSLRIVYTGAVYAGRDPAPLWQALRLMGPAAYSTQIEFYGTPGAAVLAGAARHGVSDRVAVRGALPHDEAVRLQSGADVLLLLQWNSPSEAGNIPGKLFEYLGARRPILALGYPEGETARIIQERAAGLFSNDPEAIAEWLQALLETKRKDGHIAPLPETARTGFSREAQFGRLEGFLDELLKYPSASHSS